MGKIPQNIESLYRALFTDVPHCCECSRRTPYWDMLCEACVADETILDNDSSWRDERERFDASTASAEEIRERMRELGLSTAWVS